MIIQKNKVNCHIRWMIRRDMTEVLAIENKCFDSPWSEEEFFKQLRARQVIGMVAELGDKVLGYMVYELHKDSLDVLNLAVDPKYKRYKIGTQMIDKLISKLSSHRRTSITACVRESNLAAQLFFKSEQFKCIKILNTYYNNGENAYKFKYYLENV